MKIRFRNFDFEEDYADEKPVRLPSKKKHSSDHYPEIESRGRLSRRQHTAGKRRKQKGDDQWERWIF